MSTTISPDLYGNVHFISFFSAVLSRLAYFSDKNFLAQYNKIFGPIIPTTILTELSAVSSIPEVLNDEEIFHLKANPNNYPVYEYRGKRYIAFDGMAEKINKINGEVDESYTLTSDEKVQEGAYQYVAYISIATSNYGEIYVVADKRMPACIFVVFRGTYSGKTAGAYTKPTSLFPIHVGDSQGKKESYLYGILKLLTDSIHTIIEAMRYLADNHLGATNPDSIKVFTAGHSLGGALSTIFAYVWMRVKKTGPYMSPLYAPLTSQICCVSLGAPRCMNYDLSELFCQYVKSNMITFLRVTTRRDPVPAMPFKITYFSHPCSDAVSVKEGLRETISEDCWGLYKSAYSPYGKPSVDYKDKLDCSEKKTGPYVSNPLRHTIYLNILYRSAVDIEKFLTSTFSTAEIQRTPKGDTECRVIFYEDRNGDKKYTCAFFDVNQARMTPVIDTETAIKGGKHGKKYGGALFGPKNIVEDVRMTSNAFDELIKGAAPFDITEDLPMQGPLINPFNQEMMPKVCITLGKPEVEAAKGGKKTRRHYRNKNRRKSTKKRKKNCNK